ncbi:MAG TPA: quaternary ammonium compound efflux SMR transporter SugE [Agitococcus sp.]|jgi:quaternary ammonium compound-resistance protein SugE|nr:quaternary ammonium compound efflux SMR transporter SugE [Moraxellaceae bacterium]MBK8327728.1 quaternary ammonium compound efflux SMR transporter SugE [Moraxellaceae bacterium]MBK9185596.1 quaternary ammonium compound efflux SMR transporter SugE [Moraxellaceae bacterium]MBL0230858.1 quaternary ammonium compound efflux SMR transporter SugE [Moraxellaceae bacterium]HQV80350.1 quaternary ammonium compound efflux SMR transporter SugE [Agitococcus sp.]
MAWVYLLIAGVLEVQWAVTMKYTEGFSKLWPSVFCIVGMAASVYFLALAQKTLPLGTSYAIWTGIGAVGATVFGIVLFNEPRDMARILCILLIVAGILGLKITSGH